MTYTDKKIALEKVLSSKAKLETKVTKVCEIILDSSPNKGEVGELFFLLHHGILVEWLEEPLANRVRYVLAEKPESERLVRLTEMTPTLNLPQDVADAVEAYNDARKFYGDARKVYGDARKAYGDAWDAYYDAWDAYNDARKAYYDAGKAYGDAGKAYGDAGKAYCDAGEAYNDARKAYYDAGEAYNDARKAYGDAGKAYDWTAVHKAQVPETTWDGETIAGVPA